MVKGSALLIFFYLFLIIPFNVFAVTKWPTCANPYPVDVCIPSVSGYYVYGEWITGCSPPYAVVTANVGGTLTCNYTDGNGCSHNYATLTLSAKNALVPGGYYCAGGCCSGASPNDAPPSMYKDCDAPECWVNYYLHFYARKTICNEGQCVTTLAYSVYAATELEGGPCEVINCTPPNIFNSVTCGCECPPSPGCPALCMEWFQVGESCQCVCPVDTHEVDGVCVPDSYYHVLNPHNCELCLLEGEWGQCGYYDIEESYQNPVWYPFAYPGSPLESEMVYGYRAVGDYESKWYCLSGGYFLELENYADRDYLTRTELVNFLNLFKDVDDELICDYIDQNICINGECYDVKAFFVYEDFSPVLIDECEGMECGKSKEGFVACDNGLCNISLNFDWLDGIRDSMVNKFPFAYLYFAENILEQFSNIVPGDIEYEYKGSVYVIPGYSFDWLKKFFLIGIVFGIARFVMRRIL
jgi:hypothetical protein